LPARPELGRIKQALLASGAALAMMSGSGPTVFGIFREQKDLAVAYENLSREIPGLELIVTTSSGSGPRVIQD
jgi:4-diphosphocytidyl-2-C-methyl-D-erythritol kinase